MDTYLYHTAQTKGNKMLSIEQLTIVAYATGGGILCRKCGEKERLPMSDALCAYTAGEYAGNDGLYCDNCGHEIDPPYEWACPHCDTVYSGDEAADAESEYYRAAKCSEECPGGGD